MTRLVILLAVFALSGCAICRITPTKLEGFTLGPQARCRVSVGYPLPVETEPIPTATSTPSSVVAMKLAESIESASPIPSPTMAMWGGEIHGSPISSNFGEALSTLITTAGVAFGVWMGGALP